MASCYRRCLEVARAAGVETIAFPAISTGICGYPPEAAAQIAVATIRAELAAHELPRTVTLCAFDTSAEAVLRAALAHA